MSRERAGSISDFETVIIKAAPFLRNVIKLRNCNPAPVILEQAVLFLRFFASLKNDKKRAAPRRILGRGYIVIS